MSRVLLGTFLAVSWVATSFAQEKADADKSAADRPALQRLRDDPDDAEALQEHINQTMMAVLPVMERDPQSALKKLTELESFLGGLQTQAAGSKSAVARGNMIVKAFRDRIELQQKPLAELQQALQEQPGDRTALDRYLQKAMLEITPLVRSQPNEAEKKLDEVKAFLAKLSESATDESAKSGLRAADRILANIERAIASGKKLAEMIGKPAAPLKVEAWVNGKPLTDDDLQGKVVLLDFWAVWCGPCIATFPHLREWNEKYAERGLVMIGLTNYYQYQWNDDAEKAARVPGTTPAEEQQMLEKFAAHHSLTHRFGIQADDSLAEYYGVTGIPHVVVIDQQGKVRLMKVGSGEENAKEIEGLLEKLLGDKPRGEKATGG